MSKKVDVIPGVHTDVVLRFPYICVPVYTRICTHRSIKKESVVSLRDLKKSASSRVWEWEDGEVYELCDIDFII